MNSNQFRRLVGKLNQLRGKSKQKTKSKSLKKFSNPVLSKKRELFPKKTLNFPSDSGNISKKRKTLSNEKPISLRPHALTYTFSEYNFKIDSTLCQILSEFKDFSKLKPVSPIPSSPPFKYSLKHVKPKLHFSCMEKSNDYIRNSKTYHFSSQIPIDSQNFDLQPPLIQPSKNSPIDVKSVQPQCTTSFLTTFSSRDPRISSNSHTYHNLSTNSKEHQKYLRCTKHNESPPVEPCMDCFFQNYFKNDPHFHKELQDLSNRFKNINFPNFHKPGFDSFIENTEIPLFSSKNDNIHYSVISTCEQHIFTPPRIQCDICILNNTLKQ